ncbi:Tn7-like element transposition protein TnsE [Vibrio fluvialis]
MPEMSDLDEIGIRGIPKGSKLILLGDWYRKSGNDWQVVCYFWHDEMHTIRRPLPIDMLPTLTAGTKFPRDTIENAAQGWTGTFQVPSISHWKKCRYGDIPKSLHRAEQYSEQVDDSVVYRLDSAGRTYWLPAIELARMLFFHSAEVTRASVYQGNTWQLGKSSQKDWIGEVELSSNLPVRYQNSLQFRKFFTWLFFVSEAEKSFCSIFAQINRGSREIDSGQRWTFDFSPPDLGNCEISYAGFTGGELKEHIYIREIRSISGLQSPELDTVFFSHPDDILYIQSESDSEDPDNEGKPRQPNKPPVNIKELDPDGNPKASKKRYLVKLGRSGLNFDVEPDLRRSPRHVRGLPPSAKPELDENQEQSEEELASLQEGKDTGKGVRADVDNQEPPKLIDAPEKIAFFQSMLEQLESKFKWQLDYQMGDVPQKKCRSAHLIDGRPRQFCHATLQRDDTTTVHLLEIELTKDESLSTLFFRSKNTEATYQSILNELMSSDKDRKLIAMSWKRKYNSESTIVCDYLGHPDNKVKSEGDALDAWVERAAAKILSL